MATNFTFDCCACPFCPQPSFIEVTPAMASRREVLGGGCVASTRSKGTVIRVVWGTEASPTAVVGALRTARGCTVAHSISFTDPSCTCHSYCVLWLGCPAFTIQPPRNYRRIAVTFYERP